MQKRESIFARSFATVRKQFPTLWIAAAWPFICLALCCLAWGISLRLSQTEGRPNPLEMWNSKSALGKFGFCVAFVIGTALPHALAVAGVVALVWKYLRTGVATLGDAFSAVGHNLVKIAILSVCIGAIVELGSIFFIIPGLAAMTFATFVIPVLVIEHSGMVGALTRSFTLATANLAGAIGLILVWGLMGAFLMTVLLTAFFALVQGTLPWVADLLVLWTCVIAAASVTDIFGATMLTHLYADACGGPGEA